MNHVLEAAPGHYAVATDKLVGADVPSAPLPYPAAAKGLVSASLILAWRLNEHAHRPADVPQDVLDRCVDRAREAVALFDGCTGRPDAVPAEIAALRAMAGKATAAQAAADLLDLGRPLKRAAEAAKVVTDAI
jgi:hypothetical protein